MKKLKKCLSIALAAFMLVGCSSKSENEKQKETESNNTENTHITEAAEARTLPVLSIETKNKDANVLDFVDKPVSQHVAEAIASWTPNYKMPPAPYYEECTITLTDSNGNAMMSPADAQVKVRGNWTTNYKKKPLKIQFTEKQNMLGLNNGAEQKNWLLLAEYKDGSMLRNKAALYASREIMKEDGLYAADSDLVSVEINGEYYGVYLLTEMQQISSARIKIAEPDKEYTGTDTGYFLEYDGYFYNEDELHQFPLDFTDNAPLTPYDGENESDGAYVRSLPMSKTDPKEDVGITIKSRINSQEQHDFIENYVNNVYRIMYEAAYNDKAFVFDKNFKKISESKNITPQQAVENVVDINSLVDIYIISELTCDADIYWSSFYMDADFSADGKKKLTFEAPWDFDSSMGNKDRCLDGQGFYAPNIVPDVNGGTKGGGQYDTINPWLVVLAHEDWYQELIKEKWTKVYDDGVFDRTLKLIEKDSTELEDEFRKNYQKWNNIIVNTEFVKELSEPAKACMNELQAAEFLTSWLQSRIDFLNSQWHK